MAGGCCVGGAREEKLATLFILWRTNEQCEILSCLCHIKKKQVNLFFLMGLFYRGRLVTGEWLE